MPHQQTIVLYYRDEVSPPDSDGNYSQSPTKPRRFVEFLRRTPLWPHVEVRADFEPLRPEHFLLAHTPEYVDAFLHGRRPLCENSGLRWTPALRDSVLWTNGCLLAAIAAATQRPEQVTMAPGGGFHHALPDTGDGYCTFSGQVIAALLLYRERGLRGAWLDLDGHFGNSIEDARDFAPDLNEAIPPGLNINPRFSHGQYLDDLRDELASLRRAASMGLVDYVCVAHGADSHEWDQLGYQCSTAEWLEASEIIYRELRELRRGDDDRPMPVILTLFGGYRDDHPESVLALHAMDMARCLGHLCGVHVDYEPEVRRPWTP